MIIEFDSVVVRAKLIDLAARCSDQTPAMQAISIRWLSGVEANFAAGGRPAWLPLAAATVKARAKIGRGSTPILQITGLLASNVTPFSDANSAGVSNNKKYAAIHQLGGQAGSGHKVTIPARPYLTPAQDDIDDFVEILGAYLAEPFGK